MGLVLTPVQDDTDTDSTAFEARRTRQLNQQSYFVGCCYTPRKQRNASDLRIPPRYRVLSMSRAAGQPIDTDSDSGLEEHIDSNNNGRKQVHWPSQRLVTMHEMIEEGEDFADSRRSDDVDLDRLPEKIASCRRTGDPLHRPAGLPAVVQSTALARRAAARSRKKASSFSEAAKNQSFAPHPRTHQRWTRHELEVWNPEHIREVIRELFEKHDVQKKGYISWEEQEVMPLVEDFFQAHGCSTPDFPAVVFSTAYAQVKMGAAPEDTGGLNADQMCDFAKRVYDLILQEASNGQIETADSLPPES